MPKLICMNRSRPGNSPWVRLARGIPLAGVLALSACSSGAPRETPPVSLIDAEVAAQPAESIPAVPRGAGGAHAREGGKAIAVPRSEAKNILAGRNIYFSDNAAVLSEDSTKVLDQHAAYLKQNPKRLIVLRAYLDRLGSRTFSLAMVQKRLDVVVEALHKKGVAKSRIRQVMLGQRGKRLVCDTAACQNGGQRIELVFI